MNFAVPEDCKGKMKENNKKNRQLLGSCQRDKNAV